MGYGAKYDDDFHAWTQEQASCLREAAASGTNLPLDWENLAEEIESVGRRDRQRLTSRLVRVVEHLLKLEWSPAAEPRNGWKESVDIHRLEARRVLKGSPSLKATLADTLAEAWEEGRWLAVRGLARDGLPAGDIPADCPYTADQLLDPDWWPDSRHGLE